ncbi:MAG: MGMT family protein [Candidatus Omnitrophica bacterium]|nr:MGMT family protein [Candidatus Omnitrophota bacterium]
MDKKIKNCVHLTPFQKKVLLATLEIPKGETRSYKWVGKRIGSKAYRAIGQALKINPYAPEVPCHRVIASDGSIGGYAGGVAKKRELLRQEL